MVAGEEGVAVVIYYLSGAKCGQCGHWFTAAVRCCQMQSSGALRAFTEEKENFLEWLCLNSSQPLKMSRDRTLFVLIEHQVEFPG